jgi:hypothetical protein
VRDFFASGNEVEKKEVDDANETLHNLASLLLTNKTLCRQVASSTE